MALNNVLESFADTIKNGWVDAFVDSTALVRSWNGQGSRSQLLSCALKKLFETMTKLNIPLHLTFVPSSQNQADSPSRRLEDVKLYPSLSICQVLGCRSSPRIPCLGVNVFTQSPDLHDMSAFKNPYVFPPICLISHVIKYIRSL